MDITSANSTLTLGVLNLYPTPQTLQGFGVDDMYEMDAVDQTEVIIGADGYLSAGWVPQIKVMHVTLQADSTSNTFFENWYYAQENGQTVYQGFGNANQPAVGRTYDLTVGILKGFTLFAAGKKVLQPRKFSILWQVTLGSLI